MDINREKRWPIILGIIVGFLVLVGFVLFLLNTLNKDLNSGSIPGIQIEVTNSSSVSVGNLDVHTLPIGDENVSTSPKKGYIFSCQQNFNEGGAEHIGNWVHNNTWDLTEKIHVEGDVLWPKAVFNITKKGNERIINGNGLPLDSPTGIFPVQLSDPASQIGRNPNYIEKQNYSFSLPLNPTFAAQPSCVPMGIVGIGLNGVAIFNGLDAAGRDAVVHEVQDLCNGHPDEAGTYHYHGPSPCLPHANESNALVGYALDGFGIYSMYDKNGKAIRSLQLDSCHGMTSEIMWDGKMVNMYHYVLTNDYPYTIGCFRGTPVKFSAGGTFL